MTTPSPLYPRSYVLAEYTSEGIDRAASDATPLNGIMTFCISTTTTPGSE